MRLAVTGATGRMGRATLAAAREREACEVAVAVSRSADGAADRGDAGAAGHRADPAGATAGVALEPATDLPGLLADREPDALVDFTAPESSVEYVAAAADAGVPAVVGTTGFDGDGEARLRDAAGAIPVLHASNFARGVEALLAAVREAVAALPGYDVEVTETHHSGKRDAPSGTAKAILDAVDGVRGESAERVHGRRTGRSRREGDGPRREGEQPRRSDREPRCEDDGPRRRGDRPRREGESEVGVHARRAGDVTGAHEVLVAGHHEELRLVHRAGSRRVFAAGAIDAAAWLAGRDAGWYRFAEVLDP